MFIVSWLFDKLGYMPKPAVRINLDEWPFPVVKKTAKKAVKIPKATTRTKKTK
jgi:hypothetical protein